MPSTEITTVDPGGYLALNHEPSDLHEILTDVLGGDELSERDLPRVKVPSGGGTTWEIPVLGGIEPSQTLSGILVYHKQTRAYWKPDADTGTPPDCRSQGPDGTAIGIGDPGVPCADCPLSKFGTAIDDKGQPAPGQACNKKEVWFLLPPGSSFLPIVLALPATSLAAAKTYRVSIGSAGLRLTNVVTQIALDPDRNAKGDKFSRAVPTVGGMLSADEAKRAMEYAAALRPIFDAAAEAVTTEAIA